jgi:hypothetical protein
MGTLDVKGLVALSESCFPRSSGVIPTEAKTFGRAGGAMRILYYFLTFIFGLLGTLAVLRSAERLFVGHGVLPAQVVIGVGSLLLAWRFLGKARQRGASPAPLG